MIRGIFRALQPVVYMRLSPQRLSVRWVRTGEAVSEPPEVALSRGARREILAIGAQARARAAAAQAELVNPFAHPRSLVSDFQLGEQVLRDFLRRLARRRSLRALCSLAPRVVMHPLGNPDGGFTQVEVRALHEMAQACGAAEVVVWQGRDLEDGDLLARRFPAEGCRLS